MSDFEKELEKLFVSVREADPGMAGLELLKELRENFDWAISGYRNALKTLKDTLYEDRKHFVLELLQNADDAQFSHKKLAELRFIINQDNVELLYNEKGFDVEDVIAITDTGVSTKIGRKHSSRSFIGEKGIGFKSVFAIASDVEIESPPWHFTLESRQERFIIPIPQDKGKLKEGDGTRLRIRFDDQSDIDEIASTVKNLVDPNGVETILFLQRISKLYVEDRRGSPVKVDGALVSPADRSEESLSISFSNSEKRFDYVLFHEDVEIPDNLAKERWERLTWEGKIKRRMSAAAILSRPESGGTYKGRLFCYLPTKIELPVPLFLQIDALTKADRERLYEPDRGWNKYILSKIPKFLTNAILRWRDNPSINERLPDYIPTSDNADQLTTTFQNFIEQLKNVSWIKTLSGEGNGWTTPQIALRADKYWTKWLSKDKEFLRSVEGELEIKFVHPDWVNKSDWEKHWEHFDIGILNKGQIAVTILSNADFPRSLIDDDDNLLKLYEYLLSWDKYTSEMYAEEIREAPIFPFSDGKRESIDNDGETGKVFWLSVKSKRSTGLENLFQYRIIDQNYTYYPKASSDASKKSKAKNEKKGRRNEVVRALLRRLQIEELDEGKVQDLQIEWLINYIWKDSKDDTEPYQILLPIFESFIAKQAWEDQDYLNSIAKLGRASFLSESEKVHEIRNMILPRPLRLQPEDNLFEYSGLESIKLPNHYFNPPTTLAQKINLKIEEERKTKRLEGLRQFLIKCGICNRPKFERVEKTYSNMWRLYDYDKPRYDLLIQTIGSDYTSDNSITITTIELNPASQKALKTSDYDQKTFARAIYDLWLGEYENVVFYSRPGYFVAKYLRYQIQNRLIRDHKWAGVERNLIPLETTNNEYTNASEATRVFRNEIEHLKMSRSIFPLVLEGEDPATKEYKSSYLDSLRVRRPEIGDINGLWNNEKIEQFTILSIAIEFVNAGINITDLKLFDKNTRKLRISDEWMIGGESDDQEGQPFIDRQYGDIGHKLGKILHLKDLSEKLREKEGIIYSDDSSIKEDFIEIYNGKSNDQASSNLLQILKKWKNGNFEVRNIISYESRFVLSKRIERSKPIVLFNDEETATRLKNNGVTCYNIMIEERDKLVFCDAVRDIGLLLPEDSGELLLEKKRALNNTEQKEFTQLVHAYLERLEPKERYRIVTKLRDLGKPNKWMQRIIKAERSSRRLSGDILIEIELPIFDGFNFVVQAKENIEACIAHLLSGFDFTPFKSAIEEIKELKHALDDGKIGPKNYLQGEKGQNGDNIRDIRDKHRQGLMDKKHPQNTERGEKEWKTGLSPEEEEETRKRIGEKFVDSIMKGPKTYEKKFKKRTKLKEVKKIVDSDAGDPKAFLNEEYSGKCQICGIELPLSSGKKWIEIFRIVETRKENWWADRPFNILGLCPNCHALAKHGGGCDFTNIASEAEEVLKGNTWAEEVPDHKGDFYLINVLIDRTKKKLVMSKLHMNHIAVLYDNKSDTQDAEGSGHNN